MSDRQIAEWVVNTCLVYGASEATAYQVAGLFLEGLHRYRHESQPKGE